MLLYSLAEYMESRAWPPGTAGALALPVAQAGMILTEGVVCSSGRALHMHTARSSDARAALCRPPTPQFWKARNLHRACAAKPVTTAMLKGARPHYVIRPRANNTASGDTLVVLHVRRRPAPPGRPRTPDLPPLPGITFTTKPAAPPATVAGTQQPAQHEAGDGGETGMLLTGVAVGTAAAAAAAARGRVDAALAWVLSGAVAGGGGRTGGLNWRLLEAGIEDIWPPRWGFGFAGD
ncbi:hypothetical protein MNEG_6264 [Monoraphidium neglectum]|uniref:Uncharacterized protein n=1 Tax=Monoraphidium neglectum TaxID=145388 RepID=A0A0D2JRU4_9CHLO|nr:hypothetical protein MNEG_6264 [Monoraphidium neglectum]KIZ01698.1 hypothetical protein MNEG_6264 [Monoraphidium neglectum]|eukprot:XP_013900717.1 hypothetical protein MNEG_6264 [Monoraphidium neglectum]